MISEKEILEFLHKVEQKKINITAVNNLSDSYCRNIVYLADNGWKITIFNDADTWDYIDSIKIEDKGVIEFDELDKMPNLRIYEPPLEVIREIYKISEKR